MGMSLNDFFKIRGKFKAICFFCHVNKSCKNIRLRRRSIHCFNQSFIELITCNKTFDFSTGGKFAGIYKHSLGDIDRDLESGNFYIFY
ncbi:MAG: hypothetical protein A2074_05340 [Candidatus Aquicultor primus]|uniref:Uncharacterized protein n=1 Tax=Candidatus Aquicultor primus TaxID=1797195 RepID=A0A1F2UII7_9ACTN|nr:MAG: hypothetical protein A2074_05340 [Candidatus Aquicultor primus]